MKVLTQGFIFAVLILNSVSVQAGNFWFKATAPDSSWQAHQLMNELNSNQLDLNSVLKRSRDIERLARREVDTCLHTSFSDDPDACSQDQDRQFIASKVVDTLNDLRLSNQALNPPSVQELSVMLRCISRPYREPQKCRELVGQKFFFERR